MKTFLYISFMALTLGLTACKHDPDLIPTTRDDTGTTPGAPGAVTDVGKPIGAPTTQIIGPAGGTLTTPDGTLTMEIPAGALDRATTLTLQPLEKTLPSGAGLAFTISPKDTKLNKAVTLVWHYTPATISGSAPELVGIAIQDDKGIWQGTTNTQVDKGGQRISARVRSFLHPISWYEQYFMTPNYGWFLPNEQIHFRIFFQPGRIDTPTSPDDDLMVPLPSVKADDEALHQLTYKELRNWKLNGQPNTFDDERADQIGRLDYVGQGGSAFYFAPSNQVPNEQNPLAISVELNLKQKGVITMVSNLTMLDQHNEFTINGTNYQNARVFVVNQDGGISMSMVENKPRHDAEKAGLNITIGADKYHGVGTYTIGSQGDELNLGAHDKQDSYGIPWWPAPSTVLYGPATITITEDNGPGKAVSGSVAGTLHAYDEATKSYRHVSVSAKFRVVSQYFQGG